jgi:hypothetical protein
MKRPEACPNTGRIPRVLVPNKWEKAPQSPSQREHFDRVRRHAGGGATLNERLDPRCAGKARSQLGEPWGMPPTTGTSPVIFPKGGRGSHGAGRKHAFTGLPAGTSRPSAVPPPLAESG